MMYVLVIAVWLGGATEPRMYSPENNQTLTIEQCRAAGAQAVERFSQIDGVTGAAFICGPSGDPV